MEEFVLLGRLVIGEAVDLCLRLYVLRQLVVWQSGCVLEGPSGLAHGPRNGMFGAGSPRDGYHSFHFAPSQFLVYDTLPSARVNDPNATWLFVTTCRFFLHPCRRGLHWSDTRATIGVSLTVGPDWEIREASDQPDYKTWLETQWSSMELFDMMIAIISVPIWTPLCVPSS